MTNLIKRNGISPSTPSFFDDTVWRDLFGWDNWATQGNTLPKVNIMENNEAFMVEMAAPGMKKEDFHVELDNDTLIIQSENSFENTDENTSFTRREFSYQSFKRSFYLPNTVEADQIKASYRDGILRLEIPKKEEAKRKPVKSIAIS
ncbi:Hsp20/alpha crystallin family protein [Algoriphagus boritolerans]|uniref:HSP20 family protein n=1 Tax=Algoriphagus boritolerans DSM 17298 = JCM 18970 TaxID=1120964 RepID=A0A1H5S9C8_9BACT|nr:Hsp20/alpha crystallin family protein [Algoriphagus boritolerans]SEF47162.1 HSP20 family protein [Algoriphagus boritolerans DSM 17298 = JCM 18970]